MPLMDGYESTERIRKAEGSKRHTPVIAMTAYAMTGDKEECMDAGMDDYICKPFTSEQIMALLQKYTKKSV